MNTNGCTRSSTAKANDESGESGEASDRARVAAGPLSQPGVSVTGGVGSEDLLKSNTDALAVVPASHVLLATSTEQDSFWPEKGLLATARAFTPLGSSHAVVPPTPSAEPMVRSRKQGSWSCIGVSPSGGKHLVDRREEKLGRNLAGR